MGFLLLVLLVYCPFVALSMKISPIDSHLHVWSSGDPPFPWEAGQTPPEALQDSQPPHLLKEMELAGVDGALIVQPINHKFDHSYVTSVLCDDRYAGRFKGMGLLDPACDDDYLLRLKQEGYVGVRFNPYLFTDAVPMGGSRAQALYQQCGLLGLSVGFMCFRGLRLHVEDIVSLVDSSPETTAIIDHWGFFLQNGVPEEDSWQALLRLGRTYPQVHCKVSAPFRNSVEVHPYPDLGPRLREAVDVFGANRLMAGSDYPFVRTFDGTGGYVRSFSGPGWGQEGGILSDEERAWVLRGTAEKVFGKW